MRIQYLGAIAIASLLTLGTAACGDTTAVNPADVSQTAAEPSAAANPSAEAKAGAQPEVYVFEGVAIRGADPVAYFTEGKAVKGSTDYETTWNGATWRFSSAENLAAFEADPVAYAPQYGGYCAWAVKSGYLASVDPEAWKIVDGKLYLNYSAGVQKQWQADIAGNIAQGDQNWPATLSSDKVSESGKSW